MKFKREFIEIDEYIDGSSEKWETVRNVNKSDKPYLDYLIKEYCGTSFFGKTFRLAYVETDKGRFWIKPKCIIQNVLLEYDDGVNWKWRCPKHSLRFTYSARINRMWNIPDDRVFCAVCGVFYAFKKENKPICKD